MPVTRRSGNIGPCSCKVGACRKCGSACKRCKCSCDGVSPIEALRRHAGRPKKSKKIRRPKRLSMAEMAVQKMRTRGMNGAKKRSWENMDEDDSEFMPTSRTIESESINVPMTCVEITTTGNDVTIEKHSKASDMLLGDIVLQNKTILEFHKVLKSVQKTKATLLLNQYFEKTINERSISTSSESSVKLSMLLDDCNLPASTLQELGGILFDISKQQRHGVVTRTQQRGKNLTSLTTLRKRIASLARHCMILQPDSPAPTNDSTVIANDSDDNASATTKTDTQISSKVNDTSQNPIDTNLDKLTDQVLTLPREFRPIRLSHDYTIRSVDDRSKAMSTKTSDVNLPKLPNFSAEILVHNEREELTVNDEEMTVSVIEGNHNSEIQSKTKKIESDISKLIDIFNLPQYQKRILPSVESRKFSANLPVDNKDRYRRMVHLGTKIVNCVFESLCPGPSQIHLKEDVMHMLNGAIDTQDRTSYETKYKKLCSALCACTRMAKKNTIERKICRAILLNGVGGGTQLNELMKEFNFSFAKGKPRLSARVDYEKLISGESVSLKARHLSRVDEWTLKKSVEFILCQDNVVSVSYGTKIVKLSNNEIIQLPKLQRKRSRIDIIKAYLNITKNDSNHVCQRSMYNILNLVTSTDQASLYAIDYVTSLLVNETTEVLQDVIDKMLDTNLARQLSEMLSVAAYFLKHNYKHHIVLEGDDVRYHGLKHALNKKTPSTTEVEKTSHTCNACRFPFYFCESLRQGVSQSTKQINREQVDDALSVINDTEEKFALYMAHVARCVNQSHAIAQKEESIKQLCFDSKGKQVHAMLIIDFKMKFEPLSSRESTVEHFAKRGIAWHGGAIIYYMYENKKDADGCNIVDKDGKEVYYTKKYIIYIDQILQGSNKQDGMTVIALLEACVTSLHIQLPFISRLIIQSDNATTYQNGHLVVGIHLLNIKMKNKIFICDFVHSETQHGKTILDAHFASTNRHLKNFMLTYKQNRVTRIQTAHGLAFALSFNSGVRNTMIQLVEFDEGKSALLSTALTQIVKSAKEYFTRVNHIYYELPQDYIPYNEIYDKLSSISFSIKVQAFSGIDHPVAFNVDIGNNTFEPADDINDTLVEVDDNDLLTTGNEDVGGESIMYSSNNNNLSTTSNKQDFSFGIGALHSKHHLRNRTISDIETSTPDTMSGEHEDDSQSSDESQSSDDDYIVEETDFEDSDSELYLDSIQECDIRRYGQTTEEEYKQMFTGVAVVKQQDFGSISSFKKRPNNTQLSLNKHEVVEERKDLFAKSIRYAKEIISSSSYFHSSDIHHHPMYDTAEDYNPTHKFVFDQSWACRKGYGRLYGKTYMDMYKDELLKLFEAGNIDSAKKMNPGKMREQLMSMFPHRFSIPSETEIKKFINSESQKLKYKSKNVNSSERRGRKAKGNEVIWANKLKPFVESNIYDSPEAIYKRFIASLGEDVLTHPPDLPKTEDGQFHKKNIKAMIYQLKSKMKKQAKKTIV